MLSRRPDVETTFATRRLFLRGLAGALAAAAVAPGRPAGRPEGGAPPLVRAHPHPRAPHRALLRRRRLPARGALDPELLPAGLPDRGRAPDRPGALRHPERPPPRHRHEEPVPRHLRLPLAADERDAAGERPAGWRRAACTCRAAPSTCASPTSVPPRCATRRSSCSAAASATTAAPTSSTSTPAASAAGRPGPAGSGAVAVALALLLAAGCATARNYEDPAAPVYAGGSPRGRQRAGRRCAS